MPQLTSRCRNSKNGIKQQVEVDMQTVLMTQLEQELAEGRQQMGPAYKPRCTICRKQIVDWKIMIYIMPIKKRTLQHT